MLSGLSAEFVFEDMLFAELRSADKDQSHRSDWGRYVVRPIGCRLTV